MFFDNFVIQCNRKGKSPTACALEMGYHRSEVSRWGKGVTPRKANLIKMAEYFGCSVEDLTQEIIPAPKSGLTDAQMELIRLIPLLT